MTVATDSITFQQGLGLGVWDVYNAADKLGTVRKVFRHGYHYWKADGLKQLHSSRIEAASSIVNL